MAKKRISTMWCTVFYYVVPSNCASQFVSVQALVGQYIMLCGMARYVRSFLYCICYLSLFTFC
jgi:hypothetical protein